jgi:hypothetical protein
LRPSNPSNEIEFLKVGAAAAEAEDGVGVGSEEGFLGAIVSGHKKFRASTVRALARARKQGWYLE